jgi:hypothetical protein
MPTSRAVAMKDQPIPWRDLKGDVMVMVKDQPEPWRNLQGRKVAAPQGTGKPQKQKSSRRKVSNGKQVAPKQ